MGSRSVTIGTNLAVLSGAVEAAFITGLENSRCKILLPPVAGEHREQMLPKGESGFGYDGTRCYMNLEEAAPQLRTLLKPDEVSANTVDRVNAYVSTPGGGTPLHFDARAIWIVQLVGEKLWLVSKRPAVERPHRNCVATEGATIVDYDGKPLAVPRDFVVTVLRPGDWMFVPKAVWHATISNRGSISATLAAPPSFD